MNTYDIRSAIFNEIRKTLAMAKRRDPYFKDADYKILVGYKINDFLISDMIIYKEDESTIRTLMGIPCLVDYADPYAIELLKTDAYISFKYILTHVI